MPKVSICIPSYKQPELLRQALNSILIQTFTDYEVIIADDSSDDSVKNILPEFNFGNKLKYYKNLKALGSPANWNEAINKASGEYIKILHHDDYFTTEDSLIEYVTMLDKNTEVDFAFSGTRIDLIQLNMKKKHVCSLSKVNKLISDPSSLFFSNLIGAPSATIIRKKALINFDEQMKWLVDIDWYIRLIKNGSGLVHTSKTLICTIHGSAGQVTQEVIDQKEVQIKEHVMLFAKLYNSNLELKRFSILFQLMFNKYSINNINELKSFVDVPFGLITFFEDIFKNKSKSTFLKKVNHWSAKYTFNDFLFSIKKMTK